MIPEAALDDLRARNPVDRLAGKWVSLRRGGKLGLTGPCPICSPSAESRSAGRFECNADKWVCAVCATGGDVIRLVMLHEGKGFREAVEWLGGAQDVDPAIAARREREREAKRARSERQAAIYREAERERLWALWSEAHRVSEGPAGCYLDRRGLAALPLPCLRSHANVPYFVHQQQSGRAQPVEIHSGPAMLAAIIGRDGKFAGLHLTWIDLAQPKGKLELAHPETGEILPAKKVRGSKQGGRIELVRHPAPRRLFMGEGIETVLSVHRALCATGRDLSDAAFWSAVDLGNLGGKHTETVPHPTAKSAAGRTLNVPGPVPDMTVPGIPIPDSVTELILLGDSDSDRFTTEAALDRGRARYAREGRTIRIAWPPAGRDFNDMLVA